MKPILLVLIAFFVAVSPSPSGGEDQIKIFTAYPLSDLSQTPQIFKELNPEENLPVGTYKVKAQLDFRKKKYAIVQQSMDFEWPDRSLPSTKRSIKVWTSRKATHFWNPKFAFKIPLTPNPNDQASPMTDFHEVRIDYRNLNPENPYKLQIEMVLNSNDTDSAIKAKSIDSGYFIRETLDMSSSSLWKEKGYGYLIKRMLGLPANALWHFKQKGGMTFIQRRFHKDLASLEYIDLVLDSKVNSKQIKVNLRIGFKDIFKFHKVLAFNEYSKETIKVKGQKILRIDSGKIFRQRYTKDKNAFLEEIILFLPGKTEDVIRKGFFQNIIFHMKPDISDDKPILLSSIAQDLSHGKKRLVFDLRDLVPRISKETTFSKLNLTVQPSFQDSPGGFELLRARAVKLTDEQLPAFLSMGKHLLQQWGGPFHDLEDGEEKVEWAHIFGYFTFRSLSPGLKDLSRFDYALKNQKMKSDFRKTPSLVQFKDIQIRTQGIFTHSESDPKGLTLKGKGNWMELDWPVRTKLEENTQFFFGLSGHEEDIVDIQITPVSDKKKLSPILVLPNQSKSIKIPSEEIDRFKIRLKFFDNHFNLKLKEIVLFKPLALTPSRALDTPILVDTETLLVPKSITGQPKNKVRVVEGHLSTSFTGENNKPGHLSWTTEIGREINKIQGLKIVYKVSPTMLAIDPCWLKITLRSTKNRIERMICTEDSTKQMVFSSQQLFQNLNIQPTELLNSITWKISAPIPPKKYPQPLSIDIAGSLLDLDIRSLHSDLARYPLLTGNEKFIFPTSLENFSAYSLLSKKPWTDLGSLSIKSKQNASINFKPFPHPYLQFKKITLEKSAPLTNKDFSSLFEKPSDKYLDQKNGGLSLKIVFLFLIMLGSWRGWRWWKSVDSLSWFKNFSARLKEVPFKIWLPTAVSLYFIGLLCLWAKWYAGWDILVSVAGIFVVLAWRKLIWQNQSHLEKKWPLLAEKIYISPGAPYITGFLLSLIVATVLLIIQLDPVADQIAAAGYYALVVGIIFEALALGKKHKVHPET